MPTVTTNNQLGADIHTHILPGIDDGAENIEAAIRLIAAEEEMGVTDIALTPHFRMSETPLDDFLSARNASFEALLQTLKEKELFPEMRFHLGAEVRYDPNLIHLDIGRLCIGNSSYLLLEPTGNIPFNFENTVSFMLSRGITPIIAHIERYDYLLRDPGFLERLIDSGAVLQCNASAVCGKNRSSTAVKLIKRGFVDLIASDCHSIDRRPPNLSYAYKKIKKESGTLIRNSIRIVNDQLI